MNIFNNLKIANVRYDLLIFILIALFLCFTIFILYIYQPENKKLYLRLKELNKWIYLCKNGILIRGILNSSEKPKISALITLYNSQNYIGTAIKSVQNQFFPDIEILIVEDGSTDNSSNVIKDLQKEDKRIKIIYNKKNRGALYSKSIGILKATGTYTMILDSDDFFAKLLKMI